MVRAALLAAMLLAVSIPVEAATGVYVMVCNGPCRAPDGTIQPSGTAVNKTVADPNNWPFPEYTLVPDKAQPIYSAVRKPTIQTGEIWAPDYGGCAWDRFHDVGPCINEAIAQAASRGGGTVHLPGGVFGLSTQIRNFTSGVKIIGQGVGISRDNANPNEYLAVTRLVWIGAADATMVDIEPASINVTGLYAVDLEGVVFDCASLAAVCVRIAQAGESTFSFGVSEPRYIGAHFAATISLMGRGTQNNDIWVTSRSTDNSYSPVGILFDKDSGSKWNFSYNRVWLASAWYNNGIGILFGDSDNNIITDLETYSNPGARGMPIVFAGGGYVAPNGYTVTGAPYSSVVQHLGSAVIVHGARSASSISAAPGNVGTGAVATYTYQTNDITPYLSSDLHFPSSAGIAAGMNVSCGGLQSGVPDNSTVSVVSSAVTITGQTFKAVPSGTACVFSYGMFASALQGTYIITATDATHFNISSPGDAHNQNNVAITNGNLVFRDGIIPFAGAPRAGDSWVLTIREIPRDLTFQALDKANALPDVYFQPGSNGSMSTTASPLPQLMSGGGLALLFQRSQCRQPGVGPNAFVVGDCGGVGATGPFSTAVNGVGNAATGWGATTLGGHNLTATGVYSYAFGADSAASGNFSLVQGAYATDRGDTAVVWGSAGANVQGAQQERMTIVGATFAAAGVLTTDGLPLNAANSLSIPPNMVGGFVLDQAVCREGANWAKWKRRDGAFTRGAGGVSYAGDVSIATTPDQAGGNVGTATLTISADGVNNVAAISVAWPNASVVHCDAAIRMLEVQ